MTIQRLILAFVTVGLAVIAALVAIAFAGADSGVRSAVRLSAAEARAEIVSTLEADTYAYGEQVAALLLSGKSQSDDLGASRIEMERSLSRLAQVTRQQIARLGGVDKVATQLPEIDNTRRMIELYHGIDLSATRAQAQQRAGNAGQAMQLFQTEVQFRLANELQPLLDQSLTGERAEIAAELDALARQRFNSTMGALATGLVGSGALVGIALLLWRAARSEAGRAAAEMEVRLRHWEEANSGLKDIDERRSQLLADVSHQLRTPLTILRGEADVALRGKAPATELRQALERVQEQAVELGQLLEDLIATARSDADSHGHDPVLVSLDEVVGAAVQEGQALAELREASIVAVLTDGQALVNADVRRLRQALVIGIDNAVKHTPPGGRIDVETLRTGASVAIRIMDRGPGLDPDELPRVFERFFRGRSETDLANQGLGIGLAIGKAVVERHGGSITLANREGGGAVLEIMLPVAEG